METELSPEVTLKNTPAPKRSRESQSLPTIGSHRAVFFVLPTINMFINLKEDAQMLLSSPIPQCRYLPTLLGNRTTREAKETNV